MSKIAIPGTILFSLLLTVGCGDGGAGELIIKRRTNLKTLGAAYQAFHESNGKSPTNATELASFMAADLPDRPEVARAITSLEEGDVVIIWNGELGAPAANAKYVLGFEAGVPATGGYVVMGDGTVRLMTVKDFVEGSLLPSPTPTR